VAFVAGLASVLSPCMLPLVPLYLAQLVGQTTYQSTKQQAGHSARFITFVHAALFVLGFTLAFVALGATASVLGSLLQAYQSQLRVIGGIILMLIGLHLTGLLSLPLFWRQKRIAFHPTRPSYPASYQSALRCITLLLAETATDTEDQLYVRAQIGITAHRDHLCHWMDPLHWADSWSYPELGSSLGNPQTRSAPATGLFGGYGASFSASWSWTQ